MLAIITTATLILINHQGATTETVKRPIHTPVPVRENWPRILEPRKAYGLK